MQQEDDEPAESHGLEIAGGTEKRGQRILKPFARQRDERRADDGAPDIGGAATTTMNRYSMPMLRLKGEGFTNRSR